MASLEQTIQDTLSPSADVRKNGEFKLTFICFVAAARLPSGVCVILEQRRDEETKRYYHYYFIAVMAS